MPRRTIKRDGAEYIVAGRFQTTDAELARAVRDRLDRLDPLPCDEHEFVEVRTGAGEVVAEFCADCGRSKDEVDSDPSDHAC